jgi:hypothetical protein
MRDFGVGQAGGTGGRTRPTSTRAAAMAAAAAASAASAAAAAADSPGGRPQSPLAKAKVIGRDRSFQSQSPLGRLFSIFVSDC